MNDNMALYHKIPSLWAREDQKPHNIIVGTYSRPEFESLQNTPWIWTEKVDGTNVRIMWDGYKVSFGGRTNNAQLPTALYARLEELFGGEHNAQKLEECFGDTPVCLYGEGYGNKIQAVGSSYIPDGVDFILFDVRIGRWWLEHPSTQDVANSLDIKCVPIMGEWTPWAASVVVQDLRSTIAPSLQVEGLVGVPKCGLLNRKGERIITKIKCKDFV
jgi:hypothetical protein